jgi:hypothetical protein
MIQVQAVEAKLLILQQKEHIDAKQNSEGVGNCDELPQLSMSSRVEEIKEAAQTKKLKFLSLQLTDKSELIASLTEQVGVHSRRMYIGCTYTA